MPKLNAKQEWLMSCFTDLSGKRTMGPVMPNPIDMPSINAYLEMKMLKDPFIASYLIKALSGIDRAYLEMIG